MRAISLILIILSSSLLIQCDESEKIEIAVEGDYFPLNENSEWKYLKEYFSTADDHTFLSSETVSHFIKGDTAIEDIHYKKIVDENGGIVKVVRKEGSKYYGRNHDLYIGFTNEYLFLDEEASLNNSWTHNKITYETEYKVIGVNLTHTFNDITYHNVMELQVSYYFQEGEEFKLYYSTLHYYAKGIGEIYTHYPYPSSLTYSDMDISLLKFTPHEN